ncbi:hypothetical protein PPYR_14593 [Photinus pyralis]|uniref:Mpv17-like protein 2 n=1 Tax=Photinus pyralis TaxID=7054 RepID=A0A5N4A5L5_PHOPY|nr:hypothetical protein PPYR_14593 [Photinus pyralis]
MPDTLREKFAKLSGVAFRRYLMYTNVAISCTLSGVGDLIQQRHEITTKKIPEWNERRTRKMALTGLPIGIICHYYYTFLDRKLPGRSLKILTTKLLVDQFVMSPISLGTFLVSVAYLENATVHEFFESLKKKLWRLYVAEWVLWPPAQAVNFYFVPPKYRLLYDNVISLGYDVYTSYVNHDNDD